MAATYKGQTKDALISLCVQRGLEWTEKSKERLIRELVEFDEAQQGDVRPADVDTMPETSGSDAGLSLAMDSDLDMYLQSVLKHVGTVDQATKLDLVRQFQAQQQRQAEMTQRQAEMEHQLRLAQLQYGRSAPQREESRESTRFKPRPEHFPVLGKDGDLDIFLQSFEKACRQFQLPKDEWARYLTPGLKGKALEVFAALPPEADGDYEAIKAALIRKYQLTPAVYRKKFRSMQRGPQESYSDLVDNLHLTFRQWTKGLSVTTLDGLMDLMVHDQFLHICPVEVRQFVTDREPTTAAQAAKLADAYVANREPEAKKPSYPSWRPGKPVGNIAAPASRPAVSPTLAPARNSSTPRKCFVCNKVGHLSFHCPDKQSAPAPKPATASARVLCAGRPKGTNDNLQTVTVGNTVTVGLRDTGAEMTLVRPELVDSQDFIPGKTLSVTGIGGVNPTIPMARVYLDWGVGSGMKEVGVSEHIPTNVLLGTDLGRLVSQYVPNDGTPVTVTSMEQEDSTQVVYTNAEPTYDVKLCQNCDVDDIATNDEVGLCLEPREVCTVDSNIKKDFLGGCNSVGEGCDVVNVYNVLGEEGIPCVAAVTRSQKRQGPDIGPDTDPSSVQTAQDASIAGGLSNPSTINIPSHIDTQSQEFRTALQSDDSLAGLRALAEKAFDPSDKERIFWERGLLYRETTPYESSECWIPERQLVVPRAHRAQLLKVAHEIPLAGHLGIRKTKDRLDTNFYWPRMKDDVTHYCRSCETSLAVHHVNTGDHHPIRQPAYRVSMEVKADMKREIEEMLSLGVIQESQSAWASPVVLVPKKDRTTRFCVDYRRLNAITEFDAYPMPRIDELLDQLASAQYITVMDLSRGYWQIPMSREAQEKSAFTTPFGLYESKVMPFGMKNAPATFQRVMGKVLQGMGDFAVAYLDDIAVFSQTWEDHLDHLTQILTRTQGAGLTIKPGKCQIGMSEVQYLGHRVGGGLLKPEPGKVDAIMAWPTPTTKTQVMSFLGTAGYYRKFVPHYSTLAKPLTDLTKKKLPRIVNWTAECEEAMAGLKAALAGPAVLQAPDFKRKFVVQTDASAYGLGAVLSQVDDKGDEHPILYLSRKLLPREVAYATVEKECLAIVWALQKLQPYLYGRQFTVVTDHNPLSWLHRVAGDNGKLLRWSLALQQYEFTIQHKKGSQHTNADGLSRQGEPIGEKLG